MLSMSAVLTPARVVPNRRAGILLMLAAGLCWSSGGIIVRSLALKDVWEVVFWRSLFMGAFVAVLLLTLRGRVAFERVRAIGWPGMISAACLAGQIYCFIIALSLTSTANTFLLMSVSPLITALVGMAFMREHLRWFTWVAIGVALAGIGIMFGSGAGIEASSRAMLGNLFALGVPCLYACQILFARKVRGQGDGAPDLMPTLLMAGVFAAVPAALLGWPVDAALRDVGLLALMGCVQLGLGCWLMTLAVPHLRAAEMGLLALTETILAPVWVWLGVGESPSASAMSGGACILGALAANAWLSLRAAKADC
jgi:drug/metabolite transporter (DMT)-like permease